VLVRFANLLGAQDGFEAHAPVGRFEPNRFGLYDVLGNVAEWCRDWYADSESLGAAPAADGERVPRIARFKVFRGACWKYSPSPAPRANYVRVSSRLPRDRDARDDFLGVRPARALEP
jgi:formylglycine-generating enzyme required for sulfatase activity